MAHVYVRKCILYTLPFKYTCISYEFRPSETQMYTIYSAL